ncbi:phospholipase C, phosphocholine-specific [Spirosoma sp. BT702]|uniref:phospholipase C n=1 Tax=Spirosoma profusum TaxID=2771354 RepID=A0A927AQZ6_9BACT|nr:phospholipase C, phosphocholine-specific [Spirosoma profusum]MBD2701471.1 phospholipase C, phosphocholine-specific [Spirosoma profusum]
MDTRREFLKKAALLAGGAGIWDGLPESIQKAMTIAPAPGSTYLDAEHVVILMQENRSFDHTYGTLQGVRGFNDPRAITLPNKNKVWFQSNPAGETYAPFRLNIHDTKSTWMSSLPHSWANQVDARNGGKYDRWLEAKPSGHKEYAHMPLTMGYYDRKDIPFYYALADAFTVCDQHFCSSLTGTTPNRLYLWSGTVREKHSMDVKARVRNEDTDYDRLASWPTFPERLEDNGISWRIYQNEINLSTGFTGEEDGWLANFSDNPIEWFSQYNVKFSDSYQRYRAEALRTLPNEIKALEQQVSTLAETSKEGVAARKTLQQKTALLKELTDEGDRYVASNFEKLSAREKALHQKAFTTNVNDPHHRQLDRLTYQDGDVTRNVAIPKGDTLHQFRADVQSGKLPTVSWIIAPENFSDHPGAPWYGSWYLSEILDILTKNPDVWKKTIFILTYDENDGYFDHVPPFVAPHPNRPETGKVSKGIDTASEHVSMEQELKRNVANPKKDARESSIGLGYRVPMVVASPWSRGGYVCSEVFDHTSVLQFLEGFLSQKTKKPIQETNISNWRRTVCGDLTSVFRPYNGEKYPLPTAVQRDTFIEGIHKAQFKDVPSGYRALSKTELEALNQSKSSLMVHQEKGTRPSCALPYQLSADGNLSSDNRQFNITFSVHNNRFGKATAGAPFTVYNMADHSVRDYAVRAGDVVNDTFPVTPDATYHFRVYGPNGFFREFMGKAAQPSLTIRCVDDSPSLTTPKLTIQLSSQSEKPWKISVIDNAYKQDTQRRTHSGKSTTLSLDLKKSFGWYDFSIRVEGDTSFEQRYAGRIETGASSISDPFMGGVV